MISPFREVRVFSNNIRVKTLAEYQLVPMKWNADKNFFEKCRFEEAEVYKDVNSRFMFTFDPEFCKTKDVALAKKSGYSDIEIPYDTWWYAGWVSTDIAKRGLKGKRSYSLFGIRMWCENNLHYELIDDGRIPRPNYDRLLLDGYTVNEAKQKLMTMPRGEEQDAFYKKICDAETHIYSIFPDYEYVEEDSDSGGSSEE